MEVVVVAVVAFVFPYRHLPLGLSPYGATYDDFDLVSGESCNFLDFQLEQRTCVGGFLLVAHSRPLEVGNMTVVESFRAKT